MRISACSKSATVACGCGDWLRMLERADLLPASQVVGLIRADDEDLLAQHVEDHECGPGFGIGSDRLDEQAVDEAGVDGEACAVFCCHADLPLGC